MSRPPAIDWVEEATGEAYGNLCERDGCDWAYLGMEENAPLSFGAGYELIEAIHRCTRCGKVKRTPIAEEGDE